MNNQAAGSLTRPEPSWALGRSGRLRAICCNACRREDSSGFGLEGWGLGSETANLGQSGATGGPSQIVRVRASRRGLLPGTRPQDRVSAGADPGRRAVDVSQGQRGTGADPCAGRGARSVRRGGSSWTDRGSFICRLCSAQTRRCGKVRSQIGRKRNCRQCSSLRSVTAQSAQGVEAESHLVFYRGNQVAIAGGTRE